MIPQISNWDNLTFVSEERDPETGKYEHTSFILIDETDTFYYGRLTIPKAQATFNLVTHALKSVSDSEVFPKWPTSGVELTQAPPALTDNVHIKRPPLDLYETLKEYNQLHQLQEMLLAEARVMEMLCQHPHPNIIRYYGCRVVRGHVTGLVMEKHAQDLDTYLKGGIGMLDRASFMNALESSVRHLHALGWAHNDLTPTNILVNGDCMPVLIDFGGCQPIGSRLKYIRGTKEWIDGEIEDYVTSDEQHDLSALDKISSWLDNHIGQVAGTKGE
ncbi:kinase-like domain-containing protein [Aspergillus avenaceus]|uniref:Kinase-like domain-containing protein n=1 Tax=Aspergillus avenaceus TaxID=36643 RepID=A0A5N6TKQ0_ASPAV|nr:kinase-like domain-containing protein [Aspergillus avenaceus]